MESVTGSRQGDMHCAWWSPITRCSLHFLWLSQDPQGPSQFQTGECDISEKAPTQCTTSSLAGAGGASSKAVRHPRGTVLAAMAQKLTSCTHPMGRVSETAQGRGSGCLVLLARLSFVLAQRPQSARRTCPEAPVRVSGSPSVGWEAWSGGCASGPQSRTSWRLPEECFLEANTSKTQRQLTS